MYILVYIYTEYTLRMHLKKITYYVFIIRALYITILYYYYLFNIIIYALLKIEVSEQNKNEKKNVSNSIPNNFKKKTFFFSTQQPNFFEKFMNRHVDTFFFFEKFEY